VRQDPNNGTYAGFVDMTATPPQNPQPIPALAMVAALVFVVAAIAAVVVYDRKPELFRSQETTSASQHGSGSAADPPPDHMDRDGQFLWRLSMEGLRLRRSKDAAINDARRICARYAGGESETADHPEHACGIAGHVAGYRIRFRDTAISVYCPGGYIDNP
jgi:hypothetical protein